jgi:hypothetical protein
MKHEDQGNEVARTAAAVPENEMKKLKKRSF